MKCVVHCLLICLCCCIIIFSTGCRRKSLVCNSDEVIGESSSSSQKYIISFKNDNVNKISIDVDVQLGGSNQESVSSLMTYVEKAFKVYKDIDGVDYNSVVQSDGFSISINTNFDNIKNSDINKISFINYEKGYNELKAEFEKNGFYCE